MPTSSRIAASMCYVRLKLNPVNRISLATHPRVIECHPCASPTRRDIAAVPTLPRGATGRQSGQPKRRNPIRTRSVVVGRLRIAVLDNIAEVLAIAEGATAYCKWLIRAVAAAFFCRSSCRNLERSSPSARFFSTIAFKCLIASPKKWYRVDSSWYSVSSASVSDSNVCPRRRSPLCVSDHSIALARRALRRLSPVVSVELSSWRVHRARPFPHP
jgi:hypothetical protein